MQDLSKHFEDGAEFTSYLSPENCSDIPTLRWGGEDWDGGANQLLMSRDSAEEHRFSGDRVIECLSQVAKEHGFVFKASLERTSGDKDPTFMFFNLEGDNTMFRPQEFIDRFTELLYAN